MVTQLRHAARLAGGRPMGYFFFGGGFAGAGGLIVSTTEPRLSRSASFTGLNLPL